MYRFIETTIARSTTALVVLALLASALVVVAPRSASAAACQSIGADHGQVNSSVVIPETTEYRVWNRLKTPDSDFNTYFLEIDGSQCYWVGAPMAENQWVWIGSKDNKASSKLTVNLTKGTHTLKFIGNDEELRLDRVIFTSDMNCVPTGNGNNCDNPSDTSPPTVKLTAPAANSTVSGQVAVTANATDNTGVKKVDFYVNSSLASSDTTSPYGFNLKTTDLPDGDHLLITKAYDAAGNMASDSYKIKVKNADIQLPPAPKDVKVTAPSYNKVTITWSPSPGASGYQIFRDGVPIAQVGANATSYTDTGLMAGTDYDYKVSAIHESGASSDPSQEASTETQTVEDSDAPSEILGLKGAAVSSGQINLSWDASVDNIGVKYYDIYRSKGTGEPQKIAQVTSTSFGDVNLEAATEYSYYVRARDANNNAGEESDTVKVKTQTVQRRSVIYGVVRAEDTDKGLAGATAILTTKENARIIHTTTRRGSYIFRGLEAGRYSATYSSDGYSSKSASVNVGDEIIRRDVKLERR
jgi:fibronectin type 3 domain-containing protein